jgi:hypothetical protein
VQEDVCDVEKGSLGEDGQIAAVHNEDEKAGPKPTP